MDRLSIKVEGDPPVIRLIGEVDMATVEEMRSCMEQVRTRVSSLSLDLSELRFIDSSGIRALIREAMALEGRGPLVLKNPSVMFMKVMKMVGVLETSDLDIVIE